MIDPCTSEIILLYLEKNSFESPRRSFIEMKQQQRWKGLQVVVCLCLWRRWIHFVIHFCWRDRDLDCNKLYKSKTQFEAETNQRSIATPFNLHLLFSGRTAQKIFLWTSSKRRTRNRELRGLQLVFVNRHISNAITQYSLRLITFCVSALSWANQCWSPIPHAHYCYRFIFSSVVL